MSFVVELQRRKVFKIGGAYLVVAWLAVQAASIGFPAFDAPPWALRIFILVSLLGFPIALVFAWAFELTAEGVKPESGTRSTRAIMAVAAALSALAFFWYFKGQPSYRANTPPNVVAPATAAPPAAAINQKSIAVLPFSDLSPAHDQDYFSDGMAEEILNALAQVKDMKVAGRTSSFFYKGKNEDLRAIGKALGVANILEGSVRKQGDKVRITAQLIRSDDDFHLWSQAYDGDLSDVFQLQERIARAITDQLKVVLSDDQKTHLVSVITNNSEAYSLYLQATAALNQRDYPKMGEAIGWLEKALQLDPNFARAHARLAMLHVVGQSPYGASKTEAEKHARLALAFDPKLAEPYTALAFLARVQRRFADARVAMDSALAREPDDAGVIFYDAQLLINTGYTRRGIERLDRALAIDPMLPNALHWRAQQFLFAGDIDMAERLWKRSELAGLSYADAGFSQVAKARGDFATARSLTTRRLLTNPGAIGCLKTPEQSVPAFVDGVNGGDAAARTKALTVIDECISAKPDKLPIWVPGGLRELGQPERALQVLGQGPTVDDAGVLNYFWSPKWQDVRQLPGFGEFARGMGFAALWDKEGVPDLCHKNAGGDYLCD
jgi:TolB-like protein